MKRMLFGALATPGPTAALAAPSDAQASTTAAAFEPCQPGETLADCAVRTADDVLWLVCCYDPDLIGPLIEDVVHICEQVVRDCLGATSTGSTGGTEE